MELAGTEGGRRARATTIGNKRTIVPFAGWALIFRNDSDHIEHLRHLTDDVVLLYR
jgi:hypothetical protein